MRALHDGGDTSGADSLAGNWSDDQGRGAVDAYIVAYAASPGDCLHIFGSYGSAAINDLQSKWVVNYVVAFPSASQAKANWARRASYLQNFDNTVGKSTGLGDNAVVLDAYPPRWFGAWSKGAWYSVLATNYDAPTARTLAAKVAERMT